MDESPHRATSLSNVELFDFIIFAKLVGVKFQLIVALIYISMITNDIEYLSCLHLLYPY